MLARSLLIFTLCLATATAFAETFPGLDAARQKFAKSDKSEAARVAYVTALARMLHDDVTAHMSGRGNPELASALSKELGQYPAPKNSDSKAFAKLLAGRWQSPRHTYLFRRDGTWRLAPEDGTTHGFWQIKGNQFTQSYLGEDNKSTDSKTTETIILLNQDYFIFGDSQGAFFEYRLK